VKGLERRRRFGHHGARFRNGRTHAEELVPWNPGLAAPDSRFETGPVFGAQ